MAKAPPKPVPSPETSAIATVPRRTVTPDQRNKRGQFKPGVSGNPGGDAGRARRELNLATIKGMRKAFEQHGQKAIDRVARQQPAIFLKLLVLLVPRELEVTHSGGVKAMSDEQLEAAFELLSGMVDQRLGEKAKVIEGKANSSPALPEPAPLPNSDSDIKDLG